VRALVFEHLRPNPIGVYGDVLDGRGIAVDRILLDEGQPIPDWRAYDFLVVMGAAASVWEHDQHPWITAETETVREAVLAGVPYFGICFGAQLLASAFGAHGYRGMEAELGINQVFLTAAARRDPVFRGFPPDLDVCEWHSNHFALPAGAVRLARSPRYENQAIRLGRVAYGIQCHLETSREDLEAWLELFPDTVGLFESRHGAGSVPVFLDDYGAFVPRLRETARQLFGRWLENALALGHLAGTVRAMRTVVPRAGEPGHRLIGRASERARIGSALALARQGGSAVIMVSGEAGTGKTALLDDAVARARGLMVLRTRGADPEGEQRFGGLAELCEPLLGQLARLPAARAGALGSALGLGSPQRGVDRYAVYAGMLDLLTAAAEEAPILMVVDDAHLLDEASAEAIPFIARRLWIDGIALLIATESDDELSNAEELRLGALDAADARALLAAKFGDELALPVVERIVESGQGNPLALLEMARDLTPEQRRARAPLDESLPPSAEWAYLRRIEALPADTRRALLVAALTQGGERETVARACKSLGLDATALDPGVQAGLVAQDGTEVTFCHELARTAVSYSALASERRLAHGALAGAVEGERRLWHQAHAATGPDDAVADGLDEVATRARDQGAYAAAAHAFEHASRLSSDPDRRGEGLLCAAQSAHLAGHVHAALEHLAAALECVSAPPLRTELEHARGRIAARSGEAARARDWLKAAARRCEHDAPAKAAEILADAVLPSLRAGSPADAVRLARHSMRLAQGASGRVQYGSTLLLGTALLFAGDYDEGGALIDRADAMAARGGADATAGQPLPYLGAALATAGRYARARELLARVIDEARNAGAADMLPYALVRLAGVELDTGRWRVAAAALAEAVQLAEETGNSADQGLALGTLAWLESAQGQFEACRAHAEEALELAERLGSGSRLDRAAAALGLLELGCGRVESAIPALEAVCELQQEAGWSDAARTPHRLPDLVEAYALAGRIGEAEAALDVFSADAERTGRSSALVLAARCRGLLAPDSELDARFADALQPSVETTGPFEQARTELLYGSRLAAAGRTVEATDHLSAALRVFERLGAEPWAGRAREEIVVAGGTVPHPQISRLERLTPLELDVALAAGSGASPDDIAHRLFLGPRSARLLQASAMAKLGVESTAELVVAIDPELSPDAPGRPSGRGSIAAVPFVDPSSLPSHEPRPGWIGRFFHSDHMTFAYYDVSADADVHEHQHPHEEVWHVVAGALELTLGDDTRVVRAGEAAIVPADERHSVRATEPTRAIVVDYPVRESLAGIRP
jgi:GMP synthase-like glutamine amidotransferase/quercetin dioxygenase-like cupin family protein/DNA-binding CsgD family transcriptional regulator